MESKSRKVLGISEEIPVHKILKFANENDDKDIRLFPLVNFQDKRVYSMNDMRNGMRLTVLFYKKMKGYFGDYFHVYCRRSDNEYIITRSNKKLNSKIEWCDHGEEKIDDNLFINRKPIVFTPISDECIKHLGIFYKDIVIF